MRLVGQGLSGLFLSIYREVLFSHYNQIRVRFVAGVLKHTLNTFKLQFDRQKPGDRRNRGDM